MATPAARETPSPDQPALPWSTMTVWGILGTLAVLAIAWHLGWSTQAMVQESLKQSKLVTPYVWRHQADEATEAIQLFIEAGGYRKVELYDEVGDLFVAAQSDASPLDAWAESVGLVETYPVHNDLYMEDGSPAGMIRMTLIDRRFLFYLPLLVGLGLVGVVMQLILTNLVNQQVMERLRLGREVARRQEAELKLRSRDEELRLDRMKREFVSVVSHELRSPLTSIHGSLRLLQGGVAGALSNEGQDLVDVASRNVSRLMRLINDILDLDKAQSGKMSLELQPIDPEEVARASVDEMRPAGVKRGVTYRFDSEHRGQHIRADPHRLQQVLVNLLSNATKHSPDQGVVQLVIGLDGDDVLFQVIDNGSGIEPAMQRAVFDKFVQTDSSDARKHEGTGLGLAIAKELVERHRGTIGVQSVPGKTCFEVRIPAFSIADPAATAP